MLSTGDPPNVDEGESVVIVIGIDAHKQTHTAAVVNRATGRTLRGFLHRGRQLADFVSVFIARRPGR